MDRPRQVDDLLLYMNRHFRYQNRLHYCISSDDLDRSRRVQLVTNNEVMFIEYDKVHHFLREATLLPVGFDPKSENKTDVARQTDEAPPPAKNGALQLPEAIVSFLQNENNAAAKSGGYLTDMMKKLCGEDGEQYVNRANALANLVQQQHKMASTQMKLLLDARRLQKELESEKAKSEKNEANNSEEKKE